MRFFILHATAAAMFGGSVSAASVCSSLIYQIFLPLSNVPAAETYCTSYFPVAPITVTATAATTTVPTTVTTTTLPTTVATTTNIFTTTVSTQTIVTTVTTITTGSPNLNRRAGTTLTTSTSTTKSTSTTTNARASSESALLSSLAAKASSFVSTLCSCIETPITKTTTTTPTFYSSVTATAYSSVTASTATTTQVTASTTTSTTAYTQPPAPTLCGNSGMSYAYFVDNFPGDDSIWDPIVHKNDNPYFTGVANQAYFRSTDRTVYGNPPPYLNYFALEQRGYIYAPETGTYTFQASTVDDDVYAWVGSQAYSGWTAGNANLFTYYRNGVGSKSFTMTLTAGNYYPFRLSYFQGGGPGSFDFYVTAPSGRQIVSPSTTGSIYLVQYSCDQITAPPYPPYGAET